MGLSKESSHLIAEAIKQGAQDLYLLPRNKNYQVYLKHNNDFELLDKITTEKAQLMINQLKYAANLDIAEHRRPQNGSFDLVEYPATNFRLSTLSNYQNQESMVMRIINAKTKQNYFLPEQLNELQANANSRGLMVFAGPVGSGKTSTMYAIAKTLSAEKMVMTIEDPVEIKSSHFFQVQVNEQIEMSYLDLLKAALRHRPDVLIIGEIRDKKTAQVAVEAALSGHLVMTTIHAKTAHGIIERFNQLGVDSARLQSVVNCLCYQRLLLSTTGQLACLIDVLKPEAINNQQDTQGKYQSWRKKLQTIYNQGQIDEKTLNHYQEG
ncbi:competence type IV pilus ATPase ComGA [Holzapfeliella sp. He02]|uniref:Competence type IV pilus ATPase ComGA n=1 Tax=Holzapfeliella saturejae TaxID=3082953 RepID=A0ABU8SG76_9LACO